MARSHRNPHSTAVLARRAPAEVETDDAQVISRVEAMAAGQKWYFTGEVCPRGHIAKRSVSNWECRACVDARKAAKRAADPEPARARDRARQNDTKRAQARASYARNADKRRAYDRNRYHNDPKRKCWQKDQANDWWKANKGKKNFMVSRRRAWVKQATPGWLTAEHLSEIRAIYQEAAARIGEWHVDHIVPLRGKTVCGLHVPWNLQILTGSENRTKGASYAPE